MAKTAWINDAARGHKFRSRDYNRCSLCGRRRGYMRRFALCRICFRENALAGNIPGITKSSW
jgi:small subunit ribosomal protein S14